MPEEKKLTVLYRVEPGCLGPNGKTQIDAFCEFASNKIKSMGLSFLSWDIQPRNDKKLPEMQFFIMGRNVSFEQAGIYMKKFGQDFEAFSDKLDDEMANYIDLFLGGMVK